MYCIIDIFNVIFSIIFYFKQKTAYDIRISDWSSDVCYSNLEIDMANKCFSTTALAGPFGIAVEGLDITAASTDQFDALVNLLYQHHIQIGRASCRERVCQYV